MADLQVTDISNVAGTGPAELIGQYAAKAWVAIEMGTGTPTANDSGNVSSLTDNGTGTTSVALVSAMNIAAFMALGTNNQTAGGEGVLSQPTSVSAFNLKTRSVASSDTDYDVSGATFGDLA